ncbi:uncharacterized protein LOC116928079 [Daphnia magna]|uniref:uncharacterized protein LOC116928079 n=1 Tax=Daphnia magna TaxID=35525 RepID=UPI001E1BB42B|nr:uncharacterized protein LOC116928079 [Daphnia magna]XP_045033366.1 uncharacterized protein LOC116928079 [Daphnia magna]XP_045033367.1 uncharacterized protein LOC116928079 [Daphnia magna]XP_045033368.1 uncharacterized protein LOC116928079 [Daphnia magna]XP_045033369.1 uncharacterized protein LOC116928079 [Daphnia magna]XP_045033370.1 uncharacterized protein LOC116928079 [Daphnia magna]
MNRCRRCRCCPALCFVAVAILILSCYAIIYQLEIVYIEPRLPKLMKPLAANYSRRFNSTCNHRADKRGHHQQVIGYSMYGDLAQINLARRYLKPLAETTQKIPQIFPGWTVRIYHNLTRGSESWRLLHKTFFNENHIDLCNATEVIEDQNLGNIFSMTWRWLPLLDEMVDDFMSRDADSPIIPREEEAVREWFKSNRLFHVMRDHPKHCVSILGGMWGVKLGQGRSRIAKVAGRMLKRNHLHEYDYDQTLLTRYIWPIARTNMVAHDSYCCQYFPHSRPFPNQRKGGAFVGMTGSLSADENSTAAECPRKCRPNVTSDWRYC